MVIVSVAPAAELAANVTVPEVADRSEPLAPSVLSGADQATTTSAATAFDSVTVNDAFPPSATFDAGPLMDTSAVSLSPGGVVVLSSSVNVTVAAATDNPETVVVPGMVIVSFTFHHRVVGRGDRQGPAAAGTAGRDRDRS